MLVQMSLFICQTELLNWLDPAHMTITVLSSMSGHVTPRVLRLG